MAKGRNATDAQKKRKDNVVDLWLSFSLIFFSGALILRCLFVCHCFVQFSALVKLAMRWQGSGLPARAAFFSLSPSSNFVFGGNKPF